MAEGKIKKDKAKEKTRWLKKEPEPAFKKEKAQDETAEVKAMDLTSPERHAAVLNDIRFAHPANAEQKAHIMSGLQHSYGNAYVQRLLSSKTIQAKLTVNPPNNQYEREADRMADVVTQTFEPQIQRQPLEEEEELLQPKPVGSQSSPEIQRQEEEEEVALKTNVANNKTPEVPNSMETRINAARDNGQPLPHSVRTSIEPHFKHDFNEVRIHTDTEAHKLSQQLGAMAFTTGKDVFFQDNTYDPNSAEGKKLLGHELTHVVQQSAAPPIANTKISNFSETSKTEMMGTIARAVKVKDEEEVKAKEAEAKEKAEAKKVEAGEKAESKKEEAKEKAKAKKDEAKQETKSKDTGKETKGKAESKDKDKETEETKGKEEAKKKTEAKKEETKEKEEAKKEEAKEKAKAKEEEETKKEAVKEKAESKKEDEEEKTSKS